MTETANPFTASHAGIEYQDVRPGYPAEAVRAVLETTPGTCVADIGAGTGKFSRAMLRMNPDLEVFAVEPSAEMRAAFVGGIAPVDGTSEVTGLPDDSVDLVVWAQSFHWVDPVRSGIEARRILRGERAGGAVVFNQLDVSIPWIHRLTRIMRSGDVHRVDDPPTLEGFAAEPVLTFPWEQALTTMQVMALARTRSSYLRSAEAIRAKMQQNLDWYLHQHLGYEPGGMVLLPYTTLVWRLR